MALTSPPHFPLSRHGPQDPPGASERPPDRRAGRPVSSLSHPRRPFVLALSTVPLRALAAGVCTTFQWLSCTPCHALFQVEARVDAFNYPWNDPLDSHDSHRHYRSFTPPISPPALSPRGSDAESKRSGRTFALVPTQVNGKHVFTHVVANPKDDNASPSVSPRQEGLPEDMRDVLRQLDELASWVKAASSSRDCTGSLSDGLFTDKGKNRLLSTGSPSEREICRDLVVRAPF